MKHQSPTPQLLDSTKFQKDSQQQLRALLQEQYFVEQPSLRRLQSLQRAEQQLSGAFSFSQVSEQLLLGVLSFLQMSQQQLLGTLPRLQTAKRVLLAQI